MGKRYNDRDTWLFETHKRHPKPQDCLGCPLVTIGAGFATTDGTGRNGIMLIGEALGETEAEKGLPFQGEAGMMLNRILHRVALKRQDFLIANTINCNPPFNVLSGAPYELEAIEHCSPYLDHIIEANKHIKVLMPMGNVALHRLLGVDKISHFHGTVHWSEKYKKWVVPTFHPSYLLQKESKEMLTVISDLNRAFEVIKAGGWTPPKIDFIEQPTAATATQFVNEYELQLLLDPDTVLSCDIETPYSKDLDEEDKDDKDSSWTIERISFAFRAGHAITMPWIDPFIALAQRLLHSDGVKLFWNGNKFDVPRLRSAIQRIGGVIIDGMDAFHFLYSDIPRGLGYAAPFFTHYAPWKHLSGSNMPFYSCMDAVAALEIFLGVKHRLMKDNLWHVFVRDFVNVQPAFDAMHQVGIGIDTGKQQELREYYIKLRDNSNELIQQLVPEELKPFVKKDGYKGKPKEVRQYIKDNPGVSEADAWGYFGYESFICGPEGETRYNKRGEFNPNSPLQIKEYIKYKYGKDAIPRDKKTGKDTTGNEELERLAKRHNDRILFTIIDSSSANDKLSSFIDNWPLGSDGRVHPTFTNNPATFRLSSVRPNSQNFPHRSEEMNRMRAMVIGGSHPGDDYYLVSADYSGIEAIEVGWYANDEVYTRVAKMGVHSFFAAHHPLLVDRVPRLDLGWSDEELRLALRDVKKVAKKTLTPGTQTDMYETCKRVVHGSNYLMSDGYMNKIYPESFPSKKDAAYSQGLYFDLFTKIRQWQYNVIQEAYDNCCVVNAFGYRRWFWDAKRWQYNQRLGKWELVPTLDDIRAGRGVTGDAKKIVSTKPQGSAAAIIRRAMCSSAVKKLISNDQLLIQIHDDLTARAHKHEVEETIELLVQGMMYPIKEQGGLIIPVEVKVGKNWYAMKEVDISNVVSKLNKVKELEYEESKAC